MLLGATSVHHVISAQWDRRKKEIMLFDNIDDSVLPFYAWGEKVCLVFHHAFF